MPGYGIVKMGLNGTGYMGKKESHLRSAKKRAARRKIVDGFPIETPFQSIEEVRDYLAGDRITCLCCGKTYKDVGKHIKMHDMTPDQYRAKYKIPWTYGLVCATTSQNYSSAVNKRMSDGWIPPIKAGEDHARMISKPKRKKFYETEVALKNLPAPTHPLTEAPDGTMETFTKRKIRLQSKFGTQEHHEKLSARSKLRASENPEQFSKFSKYWTGRKQSEEHKSKRLKRHLGL